jgi:adenine specific DNA methylase Mod
MIRAAAIEAFLRRVSAPGKILRDFEAIVAGVPRETCGLHFDVKDEPADNEIASERLELVEDEAARIGTGLRDNRLIEGENLLVLRWLVRNLRGRIDVVVADPPYNTGMDGLTYDDSHRECVIDDDPHSRWLSRMARRMRLAHELLSPRGVMFVHIDQHEVARLLLLSERVFGEGNLEMAIWPKTDPRFDRNRVEKPFRDLRMVHEYILICFKDRHQARFGKIRVPVQGGDRWVDAERDLDSIVAGLGTTSSAKDELAELLGSRTLFQTPKPRALVRELVRVASSSDSVVLDYYAGSGTTGHAVMDLNSEDGGNRTFILVTNNEGAICREITYPRLRASIEKEGYDESLRYFRLVDPGQPTPSGPHA